MKLVVTEYMSLDGAMEDPLWIGPFIDDDFLKFKFNELFGGDVLLMGRKTYEYFVPVWATGEPMEDSPGQEGFADRIEQLPKYVVSTQLETTHWNNTHVIRDNIVEAIRKLKQQPGQNILVAGSAALIQLLMQFDLVDEYRFLIFPVVVGTGKRLFDTQANATLDLTSFETFNSGVVALTYHPKQGNQD